MSLHRRLCARITLAALAGACQCALAQPGSPEAGETAIHTGVVAGALGTHPAVGGSVGRAFSRYSIAIIDASFMPLSSQTLKPYPGVVTNTSRLYDFNAGVHIRVPVRERVAPYGILGGGLLFNTYNKQVVDAGGSARFEGKSATAFGFQTGGGVRYYVSDSWGVRMEYRYTISTRNFSRVLGGVFYQFEGQLPFLSRRGGSHGRGVPVAALRYRVE